MTSSTLIPRSRPWLSRVSLGEACVLGLTTWWLLRELDRFRRRLPARHPRRLSDSSGGQSLDAPIDQLMIVMQGITGTTIDDGGQVKTSPPNFGKKGPGTSRARSAGWTIRYIRFPGVETDEVVAEQDARPA